MINYIIWILFIILYAPLLWLLYKPTLLGLAQGPSMFIKSFSAPWGRIPDYTHAYFILPIFLWLIWRNRQRIRTLYKESNSSFIGNILGLSILCLGIFIYVFGYYNSYLFVTTFSLIPALTGLVLFVYGTGILKVFSFPIFYLSFLVPPPLAVLDSITLPMRQGISVLTETILNLFNYPISRDGLLLTIGYTDIFMGQPCSGFRSLVTMFALVLVYVNISKVSLSKKAILASFIVPFALFGNLTRVIILCLITFYFGEEAGQGFFHDFSGIIVFVITILGILGIESLIESYRFNKSKNQIA